MLDLEMAPEPARRQDAKEILAEMLRKGTGLWATVSSGMEDAEIGTLGAEDRESALRTGGASWEAGRGGQEQGPVEGEAMGSLGGARLAFFE